MRSPEDDHEKRKQRTYSCERKGLTWIRLTRLLNHKFTATPVCLLDFIITHVNSFFFPHQPRGSALGLGSVSPFGWSLFSTNAKIKNVEVMRREAAGAAVRRLTFLLCLHEQRARRSFSHRDAKRHHVRVCYESRDLGPSPEYGVISSVKSSEKKKEEEIHHRLASS
ncbi:hypothetical protein B296_00002300 [Ensete ventricosum]|uniref:Uncharacterized protein n=1 Tax=Ensete ventricosum TaxID=4639 RepID=A0A427A9W1_ENSVE|nr:hypothetical protein B296_00002300 [Ensete ventricosum]